MASPRRRSSARAVTAISPRRGELHTSLIEANARLADAHAALIGLRGLLLRAEDLSGVSGPALAALLTMPLGEIGMAADELRVAVKTTAGS